MPLATFITSRFVKSLAVIAMLLSISAVAKGQDAAVPLGEQTLDGTTVITLTSGQDFRISIPLRPSRAINLGAARLDITLGGSRTMKSGEPELHLVAIQTVAQASLPAGEGKVLLHGVAPQFDPERAGEYHPVDYSVHLGSGNVTNIGVPDDTLIDTERLTQKLQKLRLRLVARAAK